MENSLKPGKKDKTQSELSYILESSSKFIDLTLEDDFFQFVAEKIQQLNKNCIVSVGLYKPASKTMSVKAVVGLGKLAGAVAKLMGGLPAGRSFVLEEHAKKNLLPGKLMEIEHGISSLSPDIPSPVWKTIEKVLSVEKAYSMGFVWKGALYGNVVIVLPKGAQLENRQLVEVLVQLSSVALQNRQIQDRLDKAYKEVESRVETRTQELTQEVAQHRQTLGLLEEKEEGYRLLAETANEIIISLTLDGTITYVNKKGLEISGYELDDALGVDFARIIPKENVQSLKKLLAKRAKGFSQPLLYETEFISATGTVLPVEVSSNLIEKNGKPHGVLVTAREIAERKKVENALKASESRYRGLISTMQEGLVEVDAHWNILFANERFVEMLGYDPDQLIGRCFKDLVSSQASSIAKEQYSLRKRGINSRYELELIRQDGKKIFILCSPNPSYDDNGVYLGGLGVISDITDRKRSEVALFESEKKYRDLFENVSDFIYFHDFEGNFIETNLASKIESGYSKEELDGKNIREILADPSEDLLQEYLDGVIQNGKLEGLVKVKTRDGEERILEFRNSLVNGPKGPVGIRGCARDISDRFMYEKKLKKEKQKLEDALEEIKTLSGLLPICASCKKIRDDKGYWNNLESYIEKYSDAAFSHSICPDCSDKLYGKEEWYKKMKEKKGKSKK